MGWFSKKENQKIYPDNHWTVTGAICGIKRCERGAFISLMNVIETENGSKKMFHQVRISEMQYSMLSDQLVHDQLVSVEGEVFYGRNNRVFNLAKEVILL